MLRSDFSLNKTDDHLFCPFLQDNVRVCLYCACVFIKLHITARVCVFACNY